MSSTGTVSNPPPAGKPSTAHSCRWRFGVFVYDLCVVFVLLIIGVIYAKNPGKYPLSSDNFNIAMRAMWFGALGGIVISLKGIYDHCCDRGDWDDCFNLWHIGRPISAALTGLITLVLLLAINPTASPAEPVVYAIAFIFGTQERRFFNFLSEVAGLVVRVPNEDQQVGLKGVDIQPAEGRAGDLVLITGRGFAQGATVTIGDNKLDKVIVAKDGTTIVGTIPFGTAVAVDVTVANPSGERVVLPGKFTYT
jgi:hypothetical protein